MPESVRDRPSRCHEYIFLLSKSERYQFSRYRLEQGQGVAKRSVWSIPTAKSELDGHHAVFPEELILPCIQATTRKNDLVLDPFCGTGTVGCACTGIDRRFIGIDLNPRYARAAVDCLGAVTNWLRASSRQPRVQGKAGRLGSGLSRSHSRVKRRVGRLNEKR